MTTERFDGKTLVAKCSPCFGHSTRAKFFLSEGRGSYGSVFQFESQKKSCWEAVLFRHAAGGSHPALPQFQVTTINNADGSVDLKIKGTSEGDRVYIAPTSGGKVQIDLSVSGVPQTPSIVVSKLDDLTIDFGDGNDSLFIVSGITMGDLRVKDGAGTNDAGFYAIQALDSDIRLGDVRFDIAQGGATFNIDAFQDVTVDSLSFRFKNTTSNSVFLTTLGNGSSIIVKDEFELVSNSSASRDRVEVKANGFQSNIQLLGGVKLALGGNDSGVLVSTEQSSAVFVKGNVDINGGFASLNGQVNVNGNVTLVTGNKSSFVNLDAGSLSRITVKKNLTIKTGNANDSIKTFSVLVGGNLSINMSKSDATSDPFGLGSLDYVSLGNTEVLGRTNVEAKGAASVNLIAQNSQMQPARFHGPATFTLGSGKVDASVNNDAASRVIFDGVQKFVGVNKPVVVKYGTNVVFRTALRKLVNAVLG